MDSVAMDRVDCVVVGAGVVGLAIARALARAGREVLVLDSAPQAGTETSSRNSEVIHAGIYYPTGSVRARLCVQGREMLYGFCREHGVDHRKLGKLIVATSPGQVAGLEKIMAQAQANGVDDLVWLSAADVAELEPEVSCCAALLSPSTGIIDSHAYMLALQADAEAHGALFVFHSPALGGAVRPGGFEITVGGAEPTRLACTHLINSAGLGAQAFASGLSGLDPASIPRRVLAKGNYYALQGVKPSFRHLVYPVPEEGGLGVHVTLDLAGQVRFGPDVEWTDHIAYDVDPARADKFYDAVRRYWPALPDGAIVPAYSGMRPKLSGPGEAARDFLIQGPGEHGVPGLVNLYGIESPGLTASLALAEDVVALLSV